MPMAIPKKSATTFAPSPDRMSPDASYGAVPAKRGSRGLPRIAVLSAQFESVEPLCRWFRQGGYPISWSAIDIDSGEPSIPVSEILLFHTTRPKFEIEILTGLLRRQHPKRPPVVLALTLREKIRELDVTIGIEDFLCAPYDPAEVEARIRFALWRRFGVQLHDMIVCGELVINLGNYEVTIRGEPADLTLKEYDLLTYLATHRGRVFTRDDLLTAVWGYNYFGGTRTVDVHVRRLRMKIERHGIKIISTVRGVGYKFGE
ncbi:MAG: response regulator transcription factor [candidate division Zixibacteria bacterium]|nr:response regulator transcription factor [candidate division Zixibacteria bacterium]